MKKQVIWNAAAHGSIVLSIVFIVLFVIDIFNPSIEFLGSAQSKWLLIIYCLAALINGVLSAGYLIRHDTMKRLRADRETHELD